MEGVELEEMLKEGYEAAPPLCFLSKTGSNSPEKLAAWTGVAAGEDPGAMALSPQRERGESHLARMYSGFRHGGKCSPFFLRLYRAASATTATIFSSRSGVPTNSGGSTYSAARYASVDRASSNCDRKSTSTISLTASTPTTASMYSCSPAQIAGFRWHSKRRLDLQGVRRRCWALVSRVDVFVARIIQEHRQKKSGGNGDESAGDFVDVLLGLQGEEKLSDFDMIAVLWEMFFRGIDTVAILLEWVMARMVLHPDVQAKALAELDAVVGRGRAREPRHRQSSRAASSSPVSTPSSRRYSCRHQRCPSHSVPALVALVVPLL